MEKKLRMLFDYQRFENDPALAKLIDDVEAEARTALGDDDLAGVSAAAWENPSPVESQDGHSQSRQGEAQRHEPKL